MRRVVFGLFSMLVGCGCLCSGCMCPPSYGYPDWQKYREAERADREAKAQPVIDALAKYKAAHGGYPPSLDALVREGLLAAVPDLASNLDHQGQAGRIEKAGPLRYEPGEGDYRLRYAFSYTEPAWTSSKDIRMEYIPGYAKWQGESQGGVGPRSPASRPAVRPTVTRPSRY